MTKFVLWLSTNPWIWLLVTLLGVAGGVLGIVFYYKSKRLKEPKYAIHSSNLIGDFSGTLNKLEVSYSGQKINSLTHTKIVLWNNGRETIAKDDIAPSDPLAVTLVGGGIIVDCQVVAVNNVANQVSVELVDSKQALIHFDFLDYKQGAVIQVLHTGNNLADIAFRGTVIGAGNFAPEDRYSNDDISRVSLFGKRYDLMSTILLLVLGLVVVHQLSSKFIGYWSVIQLVSMFAFMYLLFRNAVVPELPRGLGMMDMNGWRRSK